MAAKFKYIGKRPAVSKNGKRYVRYYYPAKRGSGGSSGSRANFRIAGR